MSALHSFIAGIFRVSHGRYQTVDIYRGVMFVLMAIYHIFIFGKNYNMIITTIPDGIGWQIFQKFIAGSFFFLVGVSLYLGYNKYINYLKYFYRLGQLIGCAFIITVTSFLLYPDAPVTFGIIHSIATCYVLGIILMQFKLDKLAIPLGIIILVIGVIYQRAVFTHPLLQWTGLSSYSSAAFDYQPLFPWFGVVLLGLGLAPWLDKYWRRLEPAPNPMTSALAFAGQHTLFLYMIHVPIILGTFEVLRLFG